MYFRILDNIISLDNRENLINKLPVFASQTYADYLKQTKNIKVIWFVGEDNDKIFFILPLAIKEQLIFRKGYFLSNIINIGSQIISNEKDFLEKIINIIKKNNICDWIQQSPNWAIFRVVPESSKFCDFGTYRINIKNNSEEELFQLMKRDYRRLIRHAEYDDIKVANGIHLLKECIEVFREALANGNNTLNNINEIKEFVISLKENVEIFVAFENEMPKSSLVIIYDRNCAYTLYGGMTKSNSQGLNHLLYWEAIKIFKSRGIVYFDFVGARVNPTSFSKLDGIKRFKKHFGGEYLIGYLWKLPISKSKYFLYIVFRRILFLLKFQKFRGDIIDQELRVRK